MIKIFTLLFLVSSLFIATSCSTTGLIECPYIIPEKQFELGEREDFFEFAGASFSIFNDSDKDISSFVVSFMVYDAEGNNPFIGSNCIVKNFNERIEAHRTEKFAVSLDSYLSQLPKDEYVLDFFYVQKITYSDGSVWSDPFGMHASSEVRTADE